MGLQGSMVKLHPKTFNCLSSTILSQNRHTHHSPGRGIQGRSVQREKTMSDPLRQTHTSKIQARSQCLTNKVVQQSSNDYLK